MLSISHPTEYQEKLYWNDVIISFLENIGRRGREMIRSLKYNFFSC